MSEQDKYDTALLGILSTEGQIENFLDVIFSFLYRRTDFFRHLIFPMDKYGFRPGVARKLVLNAFKKYEFLAAEKNLKLKESYERFLEEEKARAEAEVESEVAVQEAIAEEVVKTSHMHQEEEKKCPSGLNRNPETSGNKEKECKIGEATNMVMPSKNMSPFPIISDKEFQIEATTSCEKSPGNVSAAPYQDSAAKERIGKSRGADDDTDEESNLTRAQEIYQSNPDSYNGAIRDNYTWSQSISDLDIRIKVPDYVKKGKQVAVKVDKKHLKVTYMSKSGLEVLLVDGDLCWEVDREAIWSLVPGDHVHISTEKVQERWWDALLEGESKISTRKIDASRPITDLGDEEQAKVQEMMYNERQKRLGLPQSHEQKTHEMLKMAWNAEGSPFMGQPFDPSRLNISNGSNF